MKINVQRQPGFSIVELMVCLGIISLLIGMLMPAIQRIRGSAALIQCQSNLRQMGMAIHMYHNEYGYLPATRHEQVTNSNQNLSFSLNWQTWLLPYLEQSALWEESVRAVATGMPPFHNPPHVGYATVVKIFICPLDERLHQPMLDYRGQWAAFTSYIGNSGSMPGDGVLYAKAYLKLGQIPDGASTTIMVGERPPPDHGTAGTWYTYQHDGFNLNGKWLTPSGVLSCTPLLTHANWGDPCLKTPAPCLSPGRTSNPCDRYHYWSLHPKGANFLMVDGSTHFLKYTISDQLFRAMCTSAGGEVVEIPD